MREPADAERIERFLAALARVTTTPTTVYLVGGATAVLVGWRQTTRDIDLVIRPESDALLRAIPALKEQLALNIEFAAPDHFIPVPAGWEARSPVVKRIGDLTERGHARDLADVRALRAAGLVSAAGLREAFAHAAPELYRYPAIDPATYRDALEAALQD
jgi:hypothetical protein